MEHKIHLHDAPFNLIKGGSKTIEMRLYDDKRRLISVGDVIEFTNRTTLEKIKVSVVNLYLFKDFKELYEYFDKVSLGYREDEEAKPSDMEQYYDKNEIDKYGTIGIEVKLI